MARLPGEVEEELGPLDERREPLRVAQVGEDDLGASRPSTFAWLPPWPGTSASTSVTSQPASTSANARFEPMKPSPPVMRTLRPRSRPASSSGRTRVTWAAPHGRPRPPPPRRRHPRRESRACARPASPCGAESARASHAHRRGRGRDRLPTAGRGTRCATVGPTAPAEPPRVQEQASRRARASPDATAASLEHVASRARHRAVARLTRRRADVRRLDTGDGLAEVGGEGCERLLVGSGEKDERLSRDLDVHRHAALEPAHVLVDEVELQDVPPGLGRRRDVDRHERRLPRPDRVRKRRPQAAVDDDRAVGSDAASGS